MHAGFRLRWRLLDGSLLIIAVIALGIFAVTVSQAIDTAITRGAVPYPGASRLVRISIATANGREALSRGQADTILSWARQPFNSAGYYTFLEPLDARSGGSKAVVARVAVSEGLFRTLGVKMAFGRPFTGRDFQSTPVAAVLSNAAWHRVFAGANVIGHRTSIAGHSFLVVGVAPPGFGLGGGGDQVFVPATLGLVPMGDSVTMVGRLRAGVSYGGATAGLGAAATGLPNDERLEPSSRLEASPLLAAVLGPVKQWMDALRLAAVFVLCLATANAADLMLARAMDRQRGWSIRLALGARRSAIILRTLLEGAGLAALGCISGWCLSPLGLAIGRHFALPAAAQQVAHFHRAPIALTPHILLFSFAFSLAAGAIAGAAPALIIGAVQPGELLSDNNAWLAHAGPRRGIGLISRVFIGLQVAFAVCFAVTAGNLALGLLRISSAPLGFHPVGVTAMMLAPNPEPAQIAGLLEAVKSVPGVESASSAGSAPLVADWAVETSFGYRLGNGAWEESPAVKADAVSPGYFRLLGAPLLDGRGFDGADAGTSRRVVIVNEPLAALLWPGTDPVGGEIDLRWPAAPAEAASIIGLAPAVPSRPGAMAVPEIYFDYSQEPSFVPLGAFTLLYRGARVNGASPQFVRAAVRNALPGARVTSAENLEAVLDATWFLPRFRATAAGAFFALALAIAALGLYGAVRREMARRHPEMGVRMALGATRGGIAELLFVRAAVELGVGSALGATAGYWLTNLLRSAPGLATGPDVLVFTASIGLCWVTAAGVIFAGVLADPGSPMELLTRRPGY